MSHAVFSFEVHADGAPPLKVSQTSGNLTAESTEAARGYLLRALVDFNHFLDGLPKDTSPSNTLTPKKERA